MSSNAVELKIFKTYRLYKSILQNAIFYIQNNSLPFCFQLKR